MKKHIEKLRLLFGITLSLFVVAAVFAGQTALAGNDVVVLAEPDASVNADYSFSVCKLQSHTNSNSAYIHPCGGWTSKNGCSGNNWLTWNMESSQGKSMYDTARMALLHDKAVTVRLDGSTCNHYDVTTMIRIIDGSGA